MIRCHPRVFQGKQSGTWVLGYPGSKYPQVPGLSPKIWRVCIRFGHGHARRTVRTFQVWSMDTRIPAVSMICTSMVLSACTYTARYIDASAVEAFSCTAANVYQVLTRCWSAVAKHRTVYYVVEGTPPPTQPEILAIIVHLAHANTRQPTTRVVS